MTLSTEEAVADSSLVKGGKGQGGCTKLEKNFFAFLDELEYSRRVWNFV